MNKNNEETMKTYYVYQTASGVYKIGESYVASHVFKIKAKTLAAAKRQLTIIKKKEDKNGEV